MLGRLGKVFFECIGNDLFFEDLAVLAGHEAILNNFVHFMAPETDEVFGSFEFVDIGLHDAFVYFVDVSHVEYVVELDWRTR